MFRSKATSYAILAASEIARRHEGDAASYGVQAAEIASMYELPTAYAAKIMSQLAKARVLRSDRGPRGGFQLARPPEKITLLEMFEAIHGLVDTNGIQLGGNVPESLQRTVGGILSKVTDGIRDRLASVTLADLVKK